MLTDNPILKGKLVASRAEPTFRKTDDGGLVEFNEERFKFNVAENENVLATVTDQYRLVQNAEYVAALDMAADQLGIRLQPYLAAYHNGKSWYEFRAPEMKFRITGDPSDTEGKIILSNDYRGQGGLGIMSGWFRLICSNGMMVGEIAHKDTRRHVGEIDVFGFVLNGLTKFQARFEAERLIAESLAATNASDILMSASWSQGRQAAQDHIKFARDANAAPRLPEQILADTADRYHADLSRSITQNAREVGHNLRAVAQAVAEIATHRMQRRENGDTRTSFNFAADQWATRQLGRIREVAKSRS